MRKSRHFMPLSKINWNLMRKLMPRQWTFFLGSLTSINSSKRWLSTKTVCKMTNSKRHQVSQWRNTQMSQEMKRFKSFTMISILRMWATQPINGNWPLIWQKRTVLSARFIRDPFLEEVSRCAEMKQLWEVLQLERGSNSAKTSWCIWKMIPNSAKIIAWIKKLQCRMTECTEFFSPEASSDPWLQIENHLSNRTSSNWSPRNSFSSQDQLNTTIILKTPTT